MKIRQFDSRAEHDMWFCYVIVTSSSPTIINFFHTKKVAEKWLKESDQAGKVTTRRKAYKLGFKP
jgi:hypothetical protein